MSMTVIFVLAPLLILGSSLVFAAIVAADLQDTARPRRLAPRRPHREGSVDLPRAA